MKLTLYLIHRDEKTRSGHSSKMSSVSNCSMVLLTLMLILWPCPDMLRAHPDLEVLISTRAVHLPYIVFIKKANACLLVCSPRQSFVSRP